MKKNFLVPLVLVISLVTGYANTGKTMLIETQQQKNLISATNKVKSSDQPRVKFEHFTLGEGYDGASIEAVTQSIKLDNFSQLKTVVKILGPQCVLLKGNEIVKVTEIEPKKLLGIKTGIVGYNVHYINSEGSAKIISAQKFKNLWKDNLFLFGPAITNMKLVFTKDISTSHIENFTRRVNKIVEGLEQQYSEREVFGLVSEVGDGLKSKQINLTLVAENMIVLKNVYDSTVKRVTATATKKFGESFLGLTSSSKLKFKLEDLEELIQSFQSWENELIRKLLEKFPSQKEE